MYRDVVIKGKREIRGYQIYMQIHWLLHSTDHSMLIKWSSIRSKGGGGPRVHPETNVKPSHHSGLQKPGTKGYAVLTSVYRSPKQV